MSQSAVIQMLDLTKNFGDFTAVDHLDLEIKEVEIFGLLHALSAYPVSTMPSLFELLGNLLAFSASSRLEAPSPT